MGQPRHGGRCSSRGDGEGAVTAFAVGDLGEFCSLLILNFIPFGIKKKKKNLGEKDSSVACNYFRFSVSLFVATDMIPTKL